MKIEVKCNHCHNVELKDTAYLTIVETSKRSFIYRTNCPKCGNIANSNKIKSTK